MESFVTCMMPNTSNLRSQRFLVPVLAMDAKVWWRQTGAAYHHASLLKMHYLVCPSITSELFNLTRSPQVRTWDSKPSAGERTKERAGKWLFIDRVKSSPILLATIMLNHLCLSCPAPFRVHSALHESDIEKLHMQGVQAPSRPV